jgi:hypothetical protein
MILPRIRTAYLFRLELGEFTVRLLGLDQAANDTSSEDIKVKSA